MSARGRFADSQLENKVFLKNMHTYFKYYYCNHREICIFFDIECFALSHKVKWWGKVKLAFIKIRITLVWVNRFKQTRARLKELFFLNDLQFKFCFHHFFRGS